ncbi:protein starmaker-like [Vigna umbellata]|uniref:protein starmaker-like n=1 Tax=Vigna umbellata TaxID=87088 RepID=UPI001F5E6CB3|nr:protein starmaker-like [Vigna umbellata]
MIKRWPSRNNRTRGIKVKHILQIILLLGVCFWLIYQVKHSRDKKNEYDENDKEVSVGTKTVYRTPKLGRKDLHPGKDEDKHEHNEREEEENEHEFEENDDKFGVRVDEEEEDESRTDEMEDERGGGDDEIDETDQEQSAADTDRDEDLPDDEEEKEEESDEKENHSKEEERDGSVEKHNSHEAREQHYKGDDASSAVTHDTTTTSTETVSLLENPDVNSDFNNKEAELASEQSFNASLSNTVYSSHLHNVTTTFLDSHSEAGTNHLTVVIAGGSNDLTRNSANTSFEPNKTVIFSESYQTQTGTVNTTVTGVEKNILTDGLVQGGNKVSEENQPGSNSAVPVEIEKGDAAAGESSNLEGGVLENTTKSVASNETDNNTEVSETNNTLNITHTNENTDSIKDGIKGDSSDSHILKSVPEDRTDLDTLPDIIKEGDIVDAIATD